MKSVLKVSLLAATIMLAVGCQKEEAPAAPAKQAETKVVETKVVETKEVETKAAETQSAVSTTFNNEDEKASYALGAYFGEQLKMSIEQAEQIGVPLNQAMAVKGFDNAANNASVLKEEEVQQTLSTLASRISEKAKIKAEGEAMATKTAGDEYRANFEKQNGVTKTASGLLYQVMTPATGESPQAGDSVEVNYQGAFIDGKVFDSSYERGEPVTFPLDQVIAGWTEGVQLMQVGSKYKFVIPPELAYGSEAYPGSPIPSNSTLVFEIELLKVVKPVK